MSGNLNNILLTTSQGSNLSQIWNEKLTSRQSNSELTNTQILGRTTFDLSNGQGTLHSASIPPTSTNNPLFYVTGTTVNPISGPIALHGFPNGVNNKVIKVINMTGQTMTIVNNSTVEPVPSNRINTLALGSNLSKPPSAPKVAILVYDGVTSRWLLTNFFPKVI
jgi:hypothetical protein